VSASDFVVEARRERRGLASGTGHRLFFRHRPNALRSLREPQQAARNAKLSEQSPDVRVNDGGAWQRSRKQSA
jgi:hypothetical protein